MGVMSRANAGGGGQIANGEPFLNKDELIRYRTPLAITAIEYDRFGSRQYRNPRWVCTVEPWDSNIPIPESAYPADQDADQPGIITFGDSEVRQNQFGTGRDEQGQPLGLAAQLEDAKAQGTGYIGPVAVISDRSNSGQPFKTLADVALDDQGNVVRDARGFPVLEGVPEPAPRRAPAPARAPAGSAAPPAAQPVQQARRSTGQRARAAAPPPAPQVPPGPAQDVPVDQVPANQAPPRVRRARTAATAPAAPAAQPPAPPRAPARRAAAPTQQANPAQPAPQAPAAGSPEAYEAQQQRAARQTAPSGPAPGVAERTEVTVQEATAQCPFCNAEITGRLYPAAPDAFARFYAESARAFGWPELSDEQKAAGGQVIPHPNCPMLQQTVMLPYIEFVEE